jgi:hypothetical protein
MVNPIANRLNSQGKHARTVQHHLVLQEAEVQFSPFFFDGTINTYKT